MDDIGIAANDADHLIANLRASLKCIQKAGLKLTMHKCHFGATETGFLERTITPQGVKPQKQRTELPWKNKQNPEVEKGFATLIWVFELLQKLCPKTVRTPCPILQDAKK